MSSRNICDIVVFQNPLDDSRLFSECIARVRDMFDGYVAGMGVEWGLHRESSPHEDTLILEFEGTTLALSIARVLSISPALRVSLIPSSHLPKNIIESLLSDIVRIFRGQFSGRYFLEYDLSYHLDGMNMGKKYRLDDIKGVDMMNASRSERIVFLDAVYFLHFRLLRELSRSLDSERNIDTLLLHSQDRQLASHLELSGIRMGEIQTALIDQIAQVRTQIDILHSFLPSLGSSTLS